jgi:hypothetical protein
MEKWEVVREESGTGKTTLARAVAGCEAPAMLAVPLELQRIVHRVGLCT